MDLERLAAALRGLRTATGLGFPLHGDVVVAGFVRSVAEGVLTHQPLPQPQRDVRAGDRLRQGAAVRVREGQ